MPPLSPLPARPHRATLRAVGGALCAIAAVGVVSPLMSAAPVAARAPVPRVASARTIKATVTSDAGGTATVAGNARTSTTFTVTNMGTQSVSMNFVVTACSGSITSCSASPTAGTLVNAGDAMTVTAYFSGAGAAGSGTLTLAAKNASTGTQLSAATVNVTVTAPPPPPPPPATVSVTADPVPSLIVADRVGQSVGFRVTNTGGTSTTVAVSASCGGAAIVAGSCAASLTSLTVGAGESVPVRGVFATSASGGTGSVQLAAGTASAASVVNVGAAPAGPTTVVSVTDANPGPNRDRSQCLSVSGGPGVAYECGDLRLARGLPGVTTFGKARAMSMLYNSRFAISQEIVAANVRTPASVGTPSRVYAEIYAGPIGGSQTLRAYGDWNPSDFTPGSSRRIAFGYDGGGDPSGLYTYTMTVYFWGGGNYVGSYSATDGRYVHVNRMASPYGPGWWPSGVEQLVHLPNGEKAWIGADGSTRYYVGVRANVYMADALDRPDSLTFDGTNWIRWAEHRVQVKFNGQGQHVATVNQFGQTTTFAYTSPTSFQLASVSVPGLTTPLYQFSYPGSQMVVTAPDGAAGATRTTTITRDGDGIRSICDPDGLCSQYSYILFDAERHLQSYTNRRGTTEQFTYSPRQVLQSMTQAVGTAEQSTQTFSSVGESWGLGGMGTVASSMPGDYRWTTVLGPRAGSYIDAYVNRFGAPTLVINAGTVRKWLSYEDARFPALVTTTVATNGFTTTASYDARGNLAATTQVNPYGDGRNATISYAWDGKWDVMTASVSAEGVRTSLGIDPANGLVNWQQDGRGDSTRTWFGYVNHQLSYVQNPGRTCSADSTAIVGGCTRLWHDGSGNLVETISAGGNHVRVQHDAIGRVVKSRTQITPGDLTLWQDDSTEYDVMGRDTLAIAIGPVVPSIGAAPETLFVRTMREVDGLPHQVMRWSSPDTAHIGTVTTGYRYDALGRRIMEIATDGQIDSTGYDAAGNVVHTYARRKDANGNAYVTTMTYDALNRLTTRSVPAVPYDARMFGIAAGPLHLETWTNHPYPLYPNDPNSTDRYLAAGETATFAYDSTGGIAEADNGDARVTRTYYRNGSLATETESIRTLNPMTDGSDWTRHVYQIAHAYDRDGRLTTITHPATLAPSASQNLTQYEYTPQLGSLSRVVDPLGNAFSYGYDALGEVVTAGLPRSFAEQYEYNDDGQLRHHVGSSSGGTWRNAYLDYDARGKLVRSRSAALASDTLLAAYTGLGQLASSTRIRYRLGVNSPQDTIRFTGNESFRYDALGNIIWKSTNNTTQHNSYPFANGDVGAFTNHFGVQSGRLLSMSSSTYQDTTLYDLAGNIEFVRGVPGPGGGSYEDRASYFSADGRLRAAERRTHGPQIADSWSVAFEEYRYDALGRRVLAWARRDCSNPSNLMAQGECIQGTIRRTVWDGDRELYEIQMPGNADTPADTIESDTALVHRRFDTYTNYDPNPLFGRVAYTYGQAIDAPLSVIRLKYTDAPSGTWGAYPTFTYVPLRASDGSIDNWFVAETGNGRLCLAGGRCTNDDFEDAWSAYLVAPRSTFPVAWHGTLLGGKRDQSGMFYRRNRYYDARSGRFTQEDPIGIAGGVNTYGYAAGDPVNYSDPFGTCPDPVSGGLDSLKCALQDVWSGIKSIPSQVADFATNPLKGGFAGDLAMIPINFLGGGEERALYQGSKAALRTAIKAGEIEGISGSQGLSLLSRLGKGRVDDVAVSAGENGTIRAAFTRQVDNITEVTHRVYNRAGEELNVWIRRFNSEGKELY